MIVTKDSRKLCVGLFVDMILVLASGFSFFELLILSLPTASGQVEDLK